MVFVGVCSVVGWFLFGFGGVWVGVVDEWYWIFVLV